MVLMTQLKKHFGILLLASLALAFTGLKSSHAEEWRIATLAPDGSSWMKVLSKGALAVDVKTESRVKFKYYTSGSQGDEKDVVRKMKSGGLDGGALTSVGLSSIETSIRVLELPLLFKDVKELDYVRSKMWPTFKKRFEKKGFFLGHPGDVGFIYFYSKNPVKSVADLKKQKIWQWTDDTIIKALYKNMGVNGVPLGVPEVLPGLKTGRINATYGSPVAVNAFQWHTKVKYSTSLPLAYGVGATVIKLDKWKAMSSADNNLVGKIMAAQSKKLRKTIRRDNIKAAKAIQRLGVKKLESSPEMIAEFTKQSEKVWQDLAGKSYSKKDLEMVLKHRADYRAKNP